MPECPGGDSSIVTREQLARDAAAAGIVPGDIVVLHSSLRAIGFVHPGIDAVVGALQDVLTPRGTLVMPAFSFNVASWGIGAFHPTASPSRVGALTEVFRRMPGVVRSPHPSHSVCAWGARAAELTEGEITDYTPLGIGSPLDRAARAGGWVLLAGVGHERNSTLHVAECLAPVPYLGVSFSPGREYEIGLVARAGAPAAVVPLFEMPGSSEGFPAIEPLLESAGAQHVVRFGRARCRMMRGGTLAKIAADALRADPTLFLTAQNASEVSQRRLALVRQLMSAPGTVSAPSPKQGTPHPS